MLVAEAQMLYLVKLVPVGYDEAIPAPLATNNVVLELAVRTRRNSIDSYATRHPVSERFLKVERAERKSKSKLKNRNRVTTPL